MQVSLSLEGFTKLLFQDWFTKPLYYEITKSYYNDLLVTGCRPTEPFLTDRWAITKKGVILIPLKGNNPRLIKENLISKSLYDSIAEKKVPYCGVSINQMRLQFNRQFPTPKLHVRNKPIDLYAFRYYKAKALLQAGSTHNEIQSHFGWTNSSLVQVYTSANIYYIKA